MDVITLAMSKPKVIDLSKYCNTDGQSLTEFVLMKLAMGGGDGSIVVTDGLESFWGDVSAKSRIQFLIDVSDFYGGKIVADANNFTYDTEGNLTVIGTSFVTYIDGFKKVTVAFTRSWEFTVKLEDVG